jgi:hypothetical protein
MTQPYCHPHHSSSNNNDSNTLTTATTPHYYNNHPKKILYVCDSNLSTQNIFFMEAIKNKIIQGIFTRLIYSTPLFSINSMYYVFHVTTMHTEHFYNKAMYHFNPNQPGLSKMKELETSILAMYESNMKTTKMVQHKIRHILNSGNLKIFKNTDGTDANASNVNKYIPPSFKKNTVTLCLKIIGIWESNTEYGLIYKFIPHQQATASV